MHVSLEGGWRLVSWAACRSEKEARYSPLYQQQGKEADLFVVGLPRPLECSLRLDCRLFELLLLLRKIELQRYILGTYNISWGNTRSYVCPQLEEKGGAG